MTHQTQTQKASAQASSKAGLKNKEGKVGISRTEYRNARRLIRDNGRYALRWMTANVFAVMDALQVENDTADRLAERAAIVAYCRREGIACNPRQTA